MSLEPHAGEVPQALGLMLPLKCGYWEMLVSVVAEVLQTLSDAGVRGRSDLSDKTA